jgi:general secretion pathway protein A
MDQMMRHFGLVENPFSLSPDPRYFYMSPYHRSVVAKVDFVVRKKQGLTVIFGDIGTGKTTLARILIDRLKDDHHLVIFVTNPAYRSEMHMLKGISGELGIPPKRSAHAQMAAVKAHLTDLFAKEITPIVIIDEAQLLRGQQFEVLRQFSNFETDDQKLLQLVLVGQSELRSKLRLKRALASRVAVYSNLQALSPPELADLIHFRITVAGGAGDIFTEDAVERVFELSKGIPRECIKLCSVALELALANKSRQVSADMIEAAAPEVQI